MSKAKGSAAERKVRNEYVDSGWCVVKAAGSLGPADLVALRAGHRPRLIQVKGNRDGGPFHDFGPAERKALVDVAMRAGAQALLEYRPPYGVAQQWRATDWPR